MRTILLGELLQIIVVWFLIHVSLGASYLFGLEVVNWLWLLGREWFHFLFLAVDFLFLLVLVLYVHRFILLGLLNDSQAFRWDWSQGFRLLLRLLTRLIMMVPKLDFRLLSSYVFLVLNHSFIVLTILAEVGIWRLQWSRSFVAYQASSRVHILLLLLVLRWVRLWNIEGSVRLNLSLILI